MFFIWKEIGETPLECMQRYKISNNIPEYIKITCCGRLDPMAKGILLILLGVECKLMSRYLSLNKSYTVNAILGIATDTGDILGKITGINQTTNDIISKYILQLQNYTGKEIIQPYPNYSSIPVKNKLGEKHPLWWWALNNKLQEVVIPSKKIFIKDIQIENSKKVSVNKYIPKIINYISRVNDKHTFRQKEIIADWHKFKEDNPDFILVKIPLYLTVTSGTYIRYIIEQAGKDIGIFSHSYMITRQNFEQDKDDT